MAWVVARWYLRLRDRRSVSTARSVRFKWDLGDPEQAASRLDEGVWSLQGESLPKGGRGDALNHFLQSGLLRLLSSQSPRLVRGSLRQRLRGSHALTNMQSFRKWRPTIGSTEVLLNPCRSPARGGILRGFCWPRIMHRTERNQIKVRAFVNFEVDCLKKKKKKNF